MKDRPAAEWTLTQAAQALGEPQHRLIYLCEQDVITPDVRDADGRGSSRRFSTRNLLEFAIALRLRDLEIAVPFIRAVVHVLRVFERTVAKSDPGFTMPDALRVPRAPDLRAVISDGRRLFFALGATKSSAKVFGGIDLDELERKGKQPRRVLLASKPARAGGRDGFGGFEGSRHTRLEVNITAIAQDLPLS